MHLSFSEELDWALDISASELGEEWLVFWRGAGRIFSAHLNRFFVESALSLRRFNTDKLKIVEILCGRCRGTDY
ncbi:MAG: hypothetical protein ACYTE5_05520 [Planctomycetota bacterium]